MLIYTGILNFPPDMRGAVRAVLLLVNIAAGIATIVSSRPPTWEFLPYLGVLTMVAAPLAVLNGPHKIARVFALATFLIILIGLLMSLLWIVSGWLGALLAYYQPYLGIGLATLIILTVGSGFLAKRQTGPQRTARVVFALLLVAEATTIFCVANYLWLIFVGLALNP